MTLREKQSKFALYVSLLIQFAYAKGYQLTLGDAYAKTGHKQNSNYYIRLAVDLNLFKDGRWLKETAHHQTLGEYWESLDPLCAWGGRFGDGNHYSMEHKGRK